MAAILAHAADCLGDPHRVAAEQLVIVRRTQVARHAQVQHEIVHDLLRLSFGHKTRIYVALEVYIKECGRAAQTHRRAVLLLDGGEVGHIQPLHRFLGVFGGTGYVEAV